jgi:hypothetical protein
VLLLSLQIRRRKNVTLGPDRVPDMLKSATHLLLERDSMSQDTESEAPWRVCILHSLTPCHHDSLHPATRHGGNDLAMSRLVETHAERKVRWYSSPTLVH